MPTPPPDTGPPTRVVSTAAASNATVTPSSGAPRRRLGLALAVIATAHRAMGVYASMSVAGAAAGLIGGGHGRVLTA